MEDFEQARRNMIVEQLREREITNERVLAAMADIPREAFLPPDVRDQAYADRPVLIGQGQTISQPYIVALMCQLLDPGKEDTVLEIGAGSGYQAAVLSRLAARVTTLEIIGDLARQARENLDSLGIENVEVVETDGSDPTLRQEFDKMIVAAAVPLHIMPPRWPGLLREGGEIVLPRGRREVQMLEKYRRENDELVLTTAPCLVTFVPLLGIFGFPPDPRGDSPDW